MASISLTIQELPDFPGEAGPFAFMLERPSGGSGTAVLTIPIVNRGPESYAESQAQESWVSRRYPDLEMCFAGAWRTDDLQRFDELAADLAGLAQSAPLDAQWLLSELQSRVPPPLARAANGIPLVNPRAGVDEAIRQAARLEDLTDYSHLIALAPESAEAWLLRAARRHSEHEDFQGALEDSQRAAQLQPSLPDAWRAQGSALIALGRFADAVAPLERALALSRGSAQARVYLAYALEKAGAYAKAVAQLREAAPPKKAGPGRAADCTVHQARARCLAALGEPGQALEALNAAGRCQPGNSRVWLERSQLLDSLDGRRQEALESAAKACALAEDWEVEPLLWHAALQRGAGQPAPALETLSALQGRADAFPRLAGERGLALCDLGRFAEALADLDQYLSCVTWAPAQLARARCRHALGDLAGAQADLQALLGADALHPQALALLEEWRAEERAG
jgi:tetratricopeptide (TPR) repeat protein